MPMNVTCRVCPDRGSEICSLEPVIENVRENITIAKGVLRGITVAFSELYAPIGELHAVEDAKAVITPVRIKRAARKQRVQECIEIHADHQDFIETIISGNTDF